MRGALYTCKEKSCSLGWVLVLMTTSPIACPKLCALHTCTSVYLNSSPQ